MKPLTIAVCGDLHVGHNVGMWPYPKSQNVAQRFLWKCWNEFVSQVVDEKPDILIVNGDEVDGEQKKAGGTEATQALVSVQQTACIDLLAPLRKHVKEIYFTRSTPYHTGPLGAYSEPIAKALGARPGPVGYTHETLDLNISGVRCSFHHEIPTGAGLNRGQQLMKETIFAHLTQKQHVDLIVRSHAHFFAHVEYPKTHAVQMPAWQLATPWMLKKSPFRMQPDIGACFFDLYPGERDPVRVRKMLFDLPQSKPLKSNVR